LKEGYLLSKLVLKYGLDDVPPVRELMLFGLQWLAISVPIIIITGNVVAGFHFNDPLGQVVYLQKLFFISGLALFVQLLWGHRLPLITGPATVLLVGVVAAGSSNLAAVYTSILAGGLILFILSISGLFSYLTGLFTSRVVAVILLLIAFTMAPTIMGLIMPSSSPVAPLANLGFALGFVILMLAAGRLLTGIWKSSLIIWAVIAGSCTYLLLFPGQIMTSQGTGAVAIAFLTDVNLNFSFEPGLLFSFLVCFLALSINDLGSIQSISELIKPGDISGRITRGISLTGLSNVLSGLFGVIGPVNYSLSPGIIATTGCASRFTLLPAAAGLVVIALLPPVITFFGLIPQTVIGTVLLYVLCSQVAAGMMVAYNGPGGFKMEDGLVIGLPLMLGIIVSFLPAQVVSTFPAALRPVLGNGFVLGVLAVLVLEHVIYREG